MNMREKVARAIAAAGDVPGLLKCWDDPTGRKSAYKFADAAIDAMMEPTPELLAELQATLLFIEDFYKRVDPIFHRALGERAICVSAAIAKATTP